MVGRIMGGSKRMLRIQSSLGVSRGHKTLRGTFGRNVLDFVFRMCFLAPWGVVARSGATQTHKTNKDPNITVMRPSMAKTNTPTRIYGEFWV